MRRILARLFAVAAVLSPVGTTGIVVAPASAAGTACTGNSGTVTFSPGLTGTAKVQNIVIKGGLAGCTGSTVSSATYVAKLKSAHAATCAALSTVGETASGSVVVKWRPKGQGNSHGKVTLTETEGAGASLAGTIEDGLFAGLGVSGAAEGLTPVFTGTGAPCTKKNPLKKATFTSQGIAIS